MPLSTLEKGIAILGLGGLGVLRCIEFGELCRHAVVASSELLDA